MKGFLGKNGELLFILFVVIIVMATMVFYVISGNLPGIFGPIASATQNNGQEIPKTEPNTDPESQVTLKDGRVIKVGDQIQMLAPTYNEVNNTIEGTVTRVYPEQKRALLWVPNGVVELTYRYVVEIKATKMVQSNELNQEQPFTDTVRGVVSLNEQGAEIIHFLQDIDNPDWGWKYRAVQLDDTTTYVNLKMYNVVLDPGNAPDYIVEFYRNNSPAATM